VWGCVREEAPKSHSIASLPKQRMGYDPRGLVNGVGSLAIVGRCVGGSNQGCECLRGGGLHHEGWSTTLTLPSLHRQLVPTDIEEGSLFSSRRVRWFLALAPPAH